MRVDINNEFRIDNSAPKRSFWVLVMRKEQASDFSVYIVPVDLQYSRMRSKGVEKTSWAYDANNLLARFQVGENDKQDSDAIRLFADPEAKRTVSRLG
jgi:hypothetical protein